MNKINKLLEKIIVNINGKVVCIGNLDEFLLKKLGQNTNITYCDLLNCNTNSSGKGKSKQKSLTMKDFKKFYKKKRINYLICDINEIKKHLPMFLQSSIYINKDKIYIYGSKNDYDVQKLQKKYKRYNVQINLTEKNDDFVLEVNTNNAKNKFFKDKIYFIIDNLEIFIDKIGDIIIS